MPKDSLSLDPPEPASQVVLVIEDSPTQSVHLQSLLEENGVQVACALDGRTGLHLAHQLHPGIIVLDVQMPDIDGFQICQQLKSAPDTADIPIIMLTRHDEPAAIASGLLAGVVDYIPKDAFADVVLLETLRQIGLIKP